MSDLPAGVPFKFCTRCGHRIAQVAVMCPQCGSSQSPAALGGGQDPADGVPTSSKSFGVAMALNGVFGILGIHHFYLGNIVHGVIDLGLSIIAIWLIVTANPDLEPGRFLLGVGLLVIDFVHSLVMMIILITGNARDGQGRKVRYPGQA